MGRRNICNLFSLTVHTWGFCKRKLPKDKSVCVCAKSGMQAGPTDVQVIKSSRQSVQTQSREGPNPAPTPDVAGATRQKTVAKKPAKIQRAVQYRPATVPSPLNINGEFYVIDNFLIV